MDDPRLRAARYRQDASTGDSPSDEAVERDTPAPTAEQRAAYVEISLQQAMRRGEFDDLPGRGKPLRDLGKSHDPDWWIRRKIETERLTGLGPPALTLRVESARLNDELDALGSEGAVRERLDDFNHRVVEARRQLLGGPPVVTPTRDPDAEVEKWCARRDARAAVEAERRAAQQERLAGMTWRERRRARRRGEI